MTWMHSHWGGLWLAGLYLIRLINCYGLESYIELSFGLANYVHSHP